MAKDCYIERQIVSTKAIGTVKHIEDTDSDTLHP